MDVCKHAAVCSGREYSSATNIPPLCGDIFGPQFLTLSNIFLCFFLYFFVVASFTLDINIQVWEEQLNL